MNHEHELKKLHILTKSILTGVLVLSVGTGSAFASDDASMTSPTAVSANQAAITNSSSVVNTQTGTAADAKVKTPELLPGDFFYFIKSAYETIQMAVAVGDVKEARLLAVFAQERLAEAQALLADGKTEIANQTLQKALVSQQQSLDKLNKSTSSGSTSGTGQTASSGAESTPASTPAQNMTASPAASPIAPASDDDEGDSPVAEVKDPKQVLKVKTDLQHNIVALTAALEKVKNPRAQMALLKNIEKSFGHLEKKLSKIEGKAGSVSPTAAAVTTSVQMIQTESQALVEEKADSAVKYSTEDKEKYKGQAAIQADSVTTSADQVELKEHKEKLDKDEKTHETKMQEKEKQERRHQPDKNNEKHGNNEKGNANGKGNNH
ncbi:DUF5667 domain-containing protein [Paenibacillus cremeus]|uniref:DUF5667 domain-containing protein n=1 Tax=Paenibacillus cremeus TaxID=2163881 RepID=A0A559KG38_9BACL|nr:DUF5667 domain-containing protein [Paenibacillus cremeus]TVY11086.1 hypothetical protein FPZ49_04365 [Paenibacillus cremeus]